MTGALNGFAFTQPKWENAAKGYDQNATAWPEYNGGIEMPKRVHLRLGLRYFRFASSKAPREQSQLGGGWWMEFETLNTISSFARQHSTPRHAARYLLGLPWEWTKCDKLVSAILEKPLDAFRGKGKPAVSRSLDEPGAHPNDRGTSYIPPQHLEIMQLYIPDLTSVRAQAFPNPTIEDVWTSSYFKR